METKDIGMMTAYLGIATAVFGAYKLIQIIEKEFDRRFGHG